MNELTLDRIKLTRFIGFARSGIKVFEASFERLLQLLVSSNGSGKSTLISELSFFPIDKELFEDDGGKELDFRFNGKPYRFESNHKKHYLFDLTTGENLNPGGTISRIIELNKELFGIDWYTWSICTGVTSFTKSDPNNRRAWIERISGTDFTYPFAVHKSIVGSINGTKRMLTKVETELAEERVKLISDAELIELEQQSKLLTQLGQKVMLYRGKDVTLEAAEKIGEQIASYQLRVLDLQKRYNALDDLRNDFSEYKDIHSMEERYHALKENKAVLEARYTSLLRDIGEKTKLMENFNKGRSINVKEINSNLKEIDKSIERINNEIVNGGDADVIPYLSDLTFANASRISDSLITINHDLSRQLVVGMDLQEDAFIIEPTADEISQTEYRMAELTSEYNSVNGYIKMLQEHIDGVEHSDNIRCERCGEEFKLGENQVLSQKKEMDERIERREAIIEEGKILRAVIDVVKEKRENRTNVLELFSQLPAWLTELIRAQLSGNINLTGFISYIDTVTKMIGKHSTILELNEDKNVLRGMLDDYNRLMSLGEGDNLADRLVDGEKELIDLQTDRTSLIDELSDLEKIIQLYKQHEQVLNDLADALVELDNAKEVYLQAMQDATLTIIGRDLHIELGVITRIIHESDINRTMVERLTKMIEDAKADLEVYKDLEAVLSPKTGLIAEQLVGYCKQFALHTTSVLSRIWGYPMTILPCKVGNKGLTYKFPIDIGYVRPVSDISKGSKSMRSVIDLAIMLATRESLKMEGIPLFLDEVGSGFDTVHNTRLAEFILEILKAAKCSNVFFVHHDVGMRASLGDHDSIVIDAKQIVIDSGYNEHVTISYY